MAWVPEDASHNVLAAVAGSTWNEWADGASLDTAPHHQVQPVHAFRINTRFKDQSIQYEKGMQGQYLGQNDKGFARIFIQGVTEGDGFRNRLVPRKYIDVGPLWEDDINKWRLDTQLAGTTVNSQAWKFTPPPDQTVLGKTIARLISAFYHTPPPFTHDKTTDLIDRSNITVLTTTIIDGIRKAGLYETLSSPKPFTALDLLKVARYKIRDSNSSDEAGAYARFHLTTKGVKFWMPEATYAYVGKTNDFARRNEEHKYTTSSYGDMTNNSKSLVMIALCILSKTAEDGLYYLTEQIFVCLLETYKPSVVNPSGTSTNMLGFAKVAKYFRDMSNEVFRLTGWQGFIRRGPKSCGIQFGANCSSPLFEYSAGQDKFMFVRTDVNIKDGKTGSVVPMACYRRANRITTGTGGTVRQALRKATIAEGKRKSVIILRLRYHTKSANTLPPPGSPFELIIEVRKDGTPHPHAWARLPAIGRFENWEQANSFACRVEWEYPLGSGSWRFTYLQRSDLYRRADNQVPGSLRNYSKAISFLQWLTNSTPNHTHNWIPKLAGASLVLQNEFDFMNQVVTFRDPKNDIVMLPGRARSDQNMMVLMSRPEHGLDRVGGAFGFTEGHKSRRSCDTCLLANSGAMVAGILPGNGCVQDKNNSSVCTNCIAFGRPCCTYTAGLASLSQNKQQLTIDNKAKSINAAAALVYLPTADIPESMQSFSQQLRTIENDNQYDDGSDYEDNDQVVESESDDDVEDS
jgi:hypothetical protein